MASVNGGWVMVFIAFNFLRAKLEFQKKQSHPPPINLVQNKHSIINLFHSGWKQLETRDASVCGCAKTVRGLNE